MASPMDHHKSGLARLHQSEEFSDCKLICGPYHFNLHKVILASQSEYFRTAFKQGTFKVMPLPTNTLSNLTDLWEEGDSSIIELKTAQSDSKASAEGDDGYDEPEIVKLMVEYFYHFDYLRDAASLSYSTASRPSAAKIARSSSATYNVNGEEVRVRFPPGTPQSQQLSSLQLQQLPSLFPQQLPSQGYIIEHAKVFVIAVKYQIDGLRDLAASKFQDAAIIDWKHNDFAHSIYIAYNSTPEEVTQLRDVVADILRQHFDEIKAGSELETALCYLPRLAYDVLKRSREGDKNGNTALAGVFYRCDECRKWFTGTPAGKSKSGRPSREATWCPRCC